MYRAQRSVATHARSLRALVASVVVALGTLAIASDPAVASACGDRVVADWIDGRIDGVYPLRCYDEAVDGLPEDVRVYSTAVDDISRALQARLHSDAARAPAGNVGSAVVPSPMDPRVAEPPLALLLLVASVSLFALAGAGTWIVQRRRRRT
jgi:hypothetical protein